MVGIRDIAKEAGVSISTVSYALNGSPKVTEETRSRIIEIAQELNYVPNMAARTLKKQHTNIIGVYLYDYSGTFYGELLDGIKRGLQTYNYEMIVCSGQKSHLFIPEKMIDGAIILDWTFKNEEIENLAKQGHAIVVLDRKLNNKNICEVLLDNESGAAMVIEKMASTNSKKVYLITGSNGYDNQQRLRTSIKELERYGIDYTVINGDFTEPSGIRAGENIMSMSPSFPIDIFSFNDEMAVGLYKYFRNEGLVIGKDVRIIGFDNIEIGDFLNPKLATIAYSKHRWGMIAAEKIVNLIKNKKLENESIYTTYISAPSFP